MQYEGSSTRLYSEHAIDQALLSLLLCEGPHQVWSLDELTRELGDHIQTQDAVSRLHRTGLVNRVEGCVFASRAARRACEIAG